MRDTGIVRKMDVLGRVVIPKEVRKQLDVDAGTPLEVFADEKSVILKKYQPGCAFCGEVESEMWAFRGKRVCKKCRRLIADA